MNETFPFDALLPVLRRRFPALPPKNRLGVNMTAVARAMNRTRRQVCRMPGRNVSWETADRLAVLCGMHPAQVWPDWFAARQEVAA